MPDAVGRRERLVDAQVPARQAVVVAVIERRLADEEIRVAGELGEALARAAVAGVGDRLPVRRRAGTRRSRACSAGSRIGVTSNPAAMNGCSGSYSRTVKTRSNMSRNPNRSPNCSSTSRPPACTQSSGRSSIATPAARYIAPHTHGHEIAPVVEVEVGDRDRVDVRPALALAQARRARPGPQSTSRRPDACSTM